MSETYSKLVITSGNRLLDYLKTLPEIPCGIPPLTVLSEMLGISRTTMLKLVDILIRKGIARVDGPHKLILRRPDDSDYLAEEDGKLSKADRVEHHILQGLRTGNLEPGEHFSELELAKKLGTSTVLVREALLKIARSGIIRKSPQQKWVVTACSADLVDEITIARNVCERYALQQACSLPENNAVFEKWAALKTQVGQLSTTAARDSEIIRNLESTLYSTLIGIAGNRFLEDSYHAAMSLTTVFLARGIHNDNEQEKELVFLDRLLQALLDRDPEQAQKITESRREEIADRLKAL